MIEMMEIVDKGGSGKGKTPGLGFRFTDRELLCIKRACHGAVEYMKAFGKGAQPSMVDMLRYERGIDPMEDEEVERCRKRVKRKSKDAVKRKGQRDENVGE